MKYLLVALAAFLLLATLCVFAKDKNNGPDQFSNLRFTIIKDDNGKPIRNASVILHPVGKAGKQSKGGYQLKTDSEGKAASEGVPYGKLRVQVIAGGFQTFGEDYDINQPTMDIDIRLKRPQEQFTIYDKPASDTPKPDTPPQQQPPK
jgi:hypothetical protein